MLITVTCKNLHRPTRLIALTRATNAYLFSTMNPTSDTTNSTDPRAFTLSFLMNSCGLSLESATSASKRFQFDSSEQPDSVLNLLKTRGLTKTLIKNLVDLRPPILLADPQKTLLPNFELFRKLGFFGTTLANLIAKEPRILEADAHSICEFFRAFGFSEQQIVTLTLKRPALYFYNAEKVFKPKLEYFESLGFSRAQIAQILSAEPYILERSLKNQIKPSVQILERIVGSHQNVLKAIKGCYYILEFNLEEVLESNIATLRKLGVPKSNVLKLMMLQPKSLLLRTPRFAEVVDEVNKLGFHPTKFNFLLAIKSMGVMSRSRWERKMKLYSSYGLTMDEIIAAFKLQPMCMCTSEKKIKKLMDFFSKELKLKPSMICKNPSLLLLSLEKRIIARCSVVQLLLSKNLIDRNTGLVYVLRMTEKAFLGKFVTVYQHELPEVVDAHEGKIQFQVCQASLEPGKKYTVQHLAL